jgi:hypothetical protein
VVQRKTQEAVYWRQNFTITDADIEYLYNYLLEAGVPLPFDQLGIALVRERCRKEEAALKADLEKGTLYQPLGKYSIGQQLVFSSFDLALGTIVGQRAGYNPEYGEFTVIQVKFEGEEEPREFASGLTRPHKLDKEAVRALSGGDALIPPEELYSEHKAIVSARLRETLASNEEFVSFRDSWFLRGLLAEIHLGYLNIAEAMIDVGGVPLTSAQLLKGLDLSRESEIMEEAQIFSLNWALQTDGRFDNVGPRGQTLWFLQRLEPPEVTHTPRRLQVGHLPTVDLSLLDADMRRFVVEIDDEASDPQLIGPISKAKEVAITLTYPHLRVGTLPLTPRTASIFPQGDDNHVIVALVDSTRQKIPAWVIQEGRYVYGLEKWYRQNNIPVGAYLKLRSTNDPLTVEIDIQQRRMKREWVRVARVENGRLVFQIQKWPVSCEYDELMIVGEDDPTSIDAFWAQMEESEATIYELLCDIFPELAKLDPQGTVHCKTIYSALNIARRCPSEVIFAEMASHPCFTHVGHGRWTFDPGLRT